MSDENNAKESFFKQTWVQVLSIILAAALGGLITFFTTTMSKRWERVQQDSEKLIVVEKDVLHNKELLDGFAAQMGELEGVTDELKLIVEILRVTTEEAE